MTKKQMQQYRKIQKLCQSIIKLDKIRQSYIEELEELLKECPKSAK